MNRRVRIAVHVCLFCWLFGCGGPLGPIAGGRLSGQVVSATVEDWSFAESFENVEIEVRPLDPYSVTVGHYVVYGRLYVEAGEKRWSRWRRFLHQDPRVRMRFGNLVYHGRAVLVTDPDEVEAVLPEFFAKDRDEPSAACAQTWKASDCDFSGTFFRIESARP